MGSLNKMDQKPHVVCIPYPAQGHINPMLKVAKLLHHKGFYITFVNNEYNHKRLLKSRGPDSLRVLPSFHFEAIPDGLDDNNNTTDSTQDITFLSDCTSKNCLPHLKSLILKFNDDDNNNGVPPVTCIVCDGGMSFSVQVGEELGIPVVMLWTASACGFTCYMQFHQLVEKGIVPLKDLSDITNGYLDKTINWVPGIKEIRLKEFPSFMRTTDPNDIMLNFLIKMCASVPKYSAMLINTFDALDHDILEACISQLNNLPPIYTIGPLNLQLDQVTDKDLKSIGSNLWKEEPECLDWLDNKEPNSVVYVNFGSITVMTNEQLIEFAWGLANSNKTFLWVIRPDLVAGEEAVLPTEFIEETKFRSLLAKWCPQEKVLAHPSIGGFLTHSGWNSTLESICGGVPMICWPFFAEQQTNCRFCCKEWEIGFEIEDVTRDKIEGLVRELMDGEKGKEMRDKAMELKRLAKDSVSVPHGSSFQNLEKIVHQIQFCKFADV